MIAAVLAPLAMTDLAAKIDSAIYATDASDAKEGIVSRDAPEELVRTLWRTSRRKGGYVRMQAKAEALLRKLDESIEDAFPGHRSAHGILVHPERPRAHRFYFIEV